MNPVASPRHPWKALGAVIAAFAVVHAAGAHVFSHDHERHARVVIHHELAAADCDDRDMDTDRDRDSDRDSDWDSDAEHDTRVDVHFGPNFPFDDDDAAGAPVQYPKGDWFNRD